MAEYKGRRERKRAAGGRVGEAAKPPHHMLIVIGLAPKKPKKSGGKVDGAAAKSHLGKRARGGKAKRADGGGTDDWSNDRPVPNMASHTPTTKSSPTKLMQHSGGMKPIDGMSAKESDDYNDFMAENRRQDAMDAGNNRKRGGAAKPSPAIEDWTGADDGRTGQSTNMGSRPYSADGDSDEERILGVSEKRKQKAVGGRLEGGPVPYSRGGMDTRAEGGRTDKWIQGAREKMEKKGTVGSLHSALGVPQGERIPEKKLSAAKAKAERTGNTKLMRKVTFAENVRH